MEAEPDQRRSLSLFFFRFSCSLSLPVALSLFLCPCTRRDVRACMRGTCVRARAPRRVRRVVVPKEREPREYVSILKGVAGGAETAPALATILHGTTSRSSNPHCNPNECRSPLLSSCRVIPLDPLSSPFTLQPGYLVLPPSRHGSRFRPIKTLYDHVVQRSVRRYVFLFFGLFSRSSASSFLVLFFLLPLSAVSSTCISFPFARSHCLSFSLCSSSSLFSFSPRYSSV